MKLPDEPYLRADALPDLVRQLDTLYRKTAQQVNQLSEGLMVASYNAGMAAPTTGTWAVGDFVKNSAPAEAGVAGSKYIVAGWTCLVAGTPGTWVQSRYLTGN
jgi:hypothetical protein